MANDNEYDSIVVGSGPGGATVAREIAQKGRKVLILERGNNHPARGSFLQYLLWQMIPGRSLLFTRRFVGIVRGLVTGGSSLFYYGTSFPVPVDMLKEFGIDLTGEINEINTELPISPLADCMISPMAGKIMESARQLGYDWNKLNKIMYQDKWKPGQKFEYYGNSKNTKWTARMYLNEAIESGSRLITGAMVQRVLSSNGIAIGVEYRKHGKTCSVFAPQIILAAGGIGTPVILSKSGITGVGRDFFFDPLISVCGTIKDIDIRNDEIPMSAGCHFEKEGYMLTDMSVPKPINAIFAAMVFHLSYLFRHRHVMRIMVKARDALGGRITDKGRIEKDLSIDDARKLQHGAARARRILEHAGAVKIYNSWYLAAHPGGTVKIGEFLDTDLQSLNYKNLFVCDCSVIPGEWGLPPIMTIIALGKRLAKHLA